MSIPVAAAAVTTAAVSVYSAYETSKQADKQYEAQLAQFRDSFRAATTNADWQRVDAERTFTINQTYAQDMYEIGVTTAWETFFIEDTATKATVDLEKQISDLATGAQLDKLVADAKTDIYRINEQAQLDADYAIAMAKYSNDYTTVKAATDAASKAALTQQAVMFIDQDINTIRSQLNMAREALRAGKSDAIGKELLATAQSLAMGSSTTRRINTTSGKADFMMQQKILESDSAIDKAIASQKAAATQMGIEMTNIAQTAAAQIRKTNQEANATATKIVNSAIIDNTVIKEKLAAASDYATAMNSITKQGLDEKYAINKTKSEAIIKEQMSTAKETLDAETIKNTDLLNENKYQTIRSELVSFSEEFSSTDPSAERAQALNSFLTNNKNMIAEVYNSPSFSYPIDREAMDKKLAANGLSTTTDIFGA